MASVNKKKEKVVKYTGGGAIASNITPLQELERMTMSCLLFEDNAYIDGVAISDRIKELCKVVKPQAIADLAVKARGDMKLRHIPLFLCVQLARRGELKAKTLTDVVQRPDELGEFLAQYWKDGKCPISNQVKLGLAGAFAKFNEYSFGKYKGEGKDISLRDVVMLVHPKPADATRSKLYKSILEGTLAVPDTWETELSAGKDKQATFTRLIKEDKLGGLAMLRNLRNMVTSGVSDATIKEGISKIRTERVLPFSFITASRYAPRFEAELEVKMLDAFASSKKMSGKTVVIVDVSGSMNGRMSSKSELNRLDAAKGLTIIAREIFNDIVIYCTAGSDGKRIHKTEPIRNRRGFALSEEIGKSFNSLGGGGIFLAQCTQYVEALEKNVDRLIVITDEQDTDDKANPKTASAFGAKSNYIINIASHQNGIGYGKFSHINGFSEKCFDYIEALEDSSNNQ